MLISFLLSIYLNSVFAWQPEVLNSWEQTTSTHKSLMNTPLFATFWGGLRRGVHWSRPKGKMISILPFGFSDSVSVYVQSNENKRDLVVFYPGVFGLPDHGIAPYVIDELEKKDLHVVVIPNFLSASYLMSRPPGNGNPLDEEKMNQYLLFSEVLKKIKMINFFICIKTNLFRRFFIGRFLIFYQILKIFKTCITN